MKWIITSIVIVAIIAAIATIETTKPSAGNAQRISVQVATNNAEADAARIAAKERYPKAIEFVSPDGFINSAPFNLSDVVGKKVILIDFWTYSCINCQRTLPYLEQWSTEYSNQGLLIVGVHSPEFDFEKDFDNVQRAVNEYNVSYPVVLDNEMRTWQAYNNRYWPHEYLIDIDGFIVHDHIGEGGYAETESEIRKLLEERAQVLGTNETISNASAHGQDVTNLPLTPEIYFGYAYSRGQLGNAEGWQPGQTVNYSLPAKRQANQFYMSGRWQNNPDNMESGGGEVTLRYTARQVNLVAGADSPVTLQVFLDGAFTKNVTVQAHDLYTLANNAYGEHELRLSVPAGAQLYTFTFG